MLSYIWKSIPRATFSVTWGFFEILDDWDCFWDRSSHRFSHWHAHHRRRTGGKWGSDERTDKTIWRGGSASCQNRSTQSSIFHYATWEKKICKSWCRVASLCHWTVHSNRRNKPRGGEGGGHIRVCYNFGAKIVEMYKILISFTYIDID